MLFADTYRRYKADTNAIAQWLASTAKKFGFPTDSLQGPKAANLPAQQSQRLKGKARKLAKEAAARAPPSSVPSLQIPKYIIGVKDFVTLAEFLAAKKDITVPVDVIASIDRAIFLRKTYSDHHALQSHLDNADDTKSDQGHLYFLGVLEKVLEVLKPRLPHEATLDRAASVATGVDGNQTLFENMFAALKVEEPSEEFLNAPAAKPSVRADPPMDEVYEVEPIDDPLELYLGIAALLQDLSAIRSAIKRTWLSYSQGATTLVPSAVTTNIAIQMARQLEEQFLKDHPSEKDTAHARSTFFGIQCLLQGQDPSKRVRSGDPTNLTLYDLVEVSLMSSHILLSSFGDVLRSNPLPVFKSGYFGVYNPSQDRDELPGPGKFDEDKIILLEILGDIVLFNHMHWKIGLPACDELTKSVVAFKVQGRHTLALDFAAQLHLDIHHVLRERVSMAWDNLRQYSSNSRATLDLNLSFHDKLRVETWPRENDMVMRGIIEKVGRWVDSDMFEERKVKLMVDSGVTPEPSIPHRFYRSHPWLCGSLLFGLKLNMQEVGITFANAWGSIKTSAQIYNAARKENLLNKNWDDMELTVMLHSEPQIFVGAAPRNVEEYFKRFCLSMGYSAQNFAKGGRRQKSAGIASKTGPRGSLEAKLMTPVAHELRFGYTDMYEPSGKNASSLETVLEKCIDHVEADDDESDGVPSRDALHRALNERSQEKKLHTSPEALLLISDALLAEELALTFDHFRMHRTAWRVLRAINERLADELRQLYGPGYLEKENQLPFVVGYIFMTAIQTKQMGGLLLPKKKDVVSSNALRQAADVLEGMIDSAPMGDLEIKILREQYGMEIEVEG